MKIFVIIFYLLGFSQLVFSQSNSLDSALIHKAGLDLIDKKYLLGKFNPAKEADFSLISSKYTSKAEFICVLKCIMLLLQCATVL